MTPMRAALCLCLLAWLPCVAKLQSSRAQEERMIRAAVAVGEKWRAVMGDKWRRDDSAQAQVALVRGQLAGLEGGIFADMNIDADVASMLVAGRLRGGRSILRMAGFDSAAAKLAEADRVRYHCAMAQLHADLAAATRDGDTLRLWLGRMVGGYCGAVAAGYDLRKALGNVKRQVDQAGLVYFAMDEYTSRLCQAYVPYVVAKVKQCHANRKLREGYGLAVDLVQQVPPSVSLRPGVYDLRDPVELLKGYDYRLVTPLQHHLGRYADAFVLKTADAYWDNRRLVRLLLPRVRNPDSQALDAFRKAGEDDSLRTDRTIALCELALWKKAGRLKEFKKEHPDRYRVAVPRSAAKKKK